MKTLLLSLTVLLYYGTTNAQIISTEPIFPRADQALTITYDASKGSGGLVDLPPGTDVYAHTGLITQQGGSGNWQYVVGNWGTADGRTVMTRIGNSDLYELTLGPTLLEWYADNNNDGVTIPPSVEVTELGFVFRNTDGSKEGKTEGNGDIFIDVYPSSNQLFATLFEPTQKAIITQTGQQIPVSGAASLPSTLTLTDNGQILTQTFGQNLDYTLEVTSGGFHEVIFSAEAQGQVIADTFTYIINPALTILPPPSGTEPGITYLNDSTVRLALFAPQKQYVYVLGDFNDWTPTPEYFMNRQPEGRIWWLDITGLTPGQTYAFQYWVDGEIRTADPYSELVLDDRHDGGIPNSHFPNLHPYPVGQTTDYVSLIQPGKESFNWQAQNYQRPAKERLVVYELLIRDFGEVRTYQTLTDSLDYLERLGVNAIELMPVNEFNANLSWGYDPTFHMALDKYYGTPDAFKTFVDACHERGIAVILDVVFNHAHERNPLCKLYWNQAQFRPAAGNPWLNQQATHAFNVFFDFNHEAQPTKEYVKKILKYWVEEYRIDGFRVDLSKGFTQNLNGPFDAGAYDGSRIAILKDYGDAVWAVDSTVYMILEHFAANSEEKVLSDYGFLLWGNSNYNYNEATMGYPSSNFSAVSHQSRGWTKPHLVGYMESHDEERLMFKNLTYGNSGPGYSVKDLTTALQRQELAANFFLTIPGPKMIWQFGEYGYDYSIFTCPDGTVDLTNTGCKLSPKPVRWDYLLDERRMRLFKVFSALNELRNSYEVFHTDDFELDVNQPNWKQIQLNSPDMNVNIIGNFGMTSTPLFVDFQHAGTWYEYYSGDSLTVDGTTVPLFFQAGEYRLYTDQFIGQADVVTSISQLPAQVQGFRIFPNPTDAPLTVELDLITPAVVSLDMFDQTGRQLFSKNFGNLPNGTFSHHLQLPAHLTPGIYIVHIRVDGALLSEPILLY